MLLIVLSTQIHPCTFGSSNLRVKFSNLPAQYERVRSKVDPAIAEIIRAGSFIGGHAVQSFERSFAEYVGLSQCIGVGNGTDALEVILEVSLRPGSVVGVPANSFVATAEAVTRAGHQVYMLDVDETFNVSIDSVNQALKANALDGVVIVHLFGRPVDSHVISRLIDAGIPIFEDCAQAHGATISGIRVGALGVASAFSFFPGKNLGAFGDAGAICTSDDELADSFRRLKNHGRLSKFDHDFIGRNSRMDAIQAVVLGAKLEVLDEWNDQRRHNASIYRKRLEGLGTIRLPVEDGDTGYSVYHHFVVRTEWRDMLQDFLKSNGIDSGIHYPESIHQTVAYRGKTLGPEPVNANFFSSQILSLPVAEHLGAREINYVCAKIIEFDRDMSGVTSDAVHNH